MMRSAILFLVLMSASFHVSAFKVRTIDCEEFLSGPTQGAVCGCPKGAGTYYDDCVTFETADLACASLNYRHKILGAECSSLQFFSNLYSSSNSVNTRSSDENHHQNGLEATDGSFLEKPNSPSNPTPIAAESPTKGPKSQQKEVAAFKCCACAADNDGTVCTCREDDKGRCLIVSEGPKGFLDQSKVSTLVDCEPHPQSCPSSILPRDNPVLNWWYSKSKLY